MGGLNHHQSPCFPCHLCTDEESEMPRLKAPAELPELVKAAFAHARRDGDLHYFPTQVTVFTTGTIPFQLRYSPALANKPKGPPPSSSSPSKPIDPFENPPQALRITDLGPSHFLVLNKFAVVPEHFILATTDFKPQTHVLEQSDLEATLACIASYEAARKNDEHNKDGLFAFFNSGEHSGASQPHRHIQLLPVSRMREGLDEGSQWGVMADTLGSHKAPFVTFTERINLDMEPKDLHAAYLRLYKRASRAVAIHERSPDTEAAPETGEALLSYNMAMTSSTIALFP